MGSPTKKSPNKLQDAGRPPRACTTHLILAFIADVRKKEKSAWGSAQPIEKAHFGQDNQRESKPFPLIVLDRAWLGFAGFG
jgi:hypothetical protein